MRTEPRKVDPIILTEAAKTLEKRFSTKISIGSARFLSLPDRRNALIRISLDSPSDVSPKSVIIKQSLPEKSDTDGKEALSRFVGDWAGLEFLSDLASKTHCTPHFYGGHQEHRFILLEDLGDIHLSLVDALTGADKTYVEASLKRYATSIGALHGMAYRHISDYQTILKKLNPNASIWQDDLKDLLSKISAILGKFDMSLSSALRQEINDIWKIVKEPGPFTTLIHGDICPDNVFDDPANDQMHIIDFEWSFVGNALLDGVYLRMCMPTCWCSKAFPEDVIGKCELIYRKELIKNIPAAKNDKEYFKSYTAACAYWVLIHLGYVTDIWENDSDLSDPKYLNLHPNWRPEDNLRRPRVLYRIEAFIEIAKKHDAWPQLRTMASRVLIELNSLWPEVKMLELYPVFN